MGETALQRSIRERRRFVRRSIADELRHARLDADLSLRDVGRAIDVDPSHLCRAEAGDRDLSLATLIGFAAVVGHDLSVRLYPSSGPRVHDHIQALMIEALLVAAHPRWSGRLEVAVHRPVHGVIDVVLEDAATGDVVAGEAHSALHTVDAQVRWAAQKADALPPSPGAERAGRLLLLRSTEANRGLVRSLPETFRAAYPARSADAWDALHGGERRWPGDAILWVDVSGQATRVLQGPPRGLLT